MNFFMAGGQGDPGNPAGGCQQAVKMLYALSCAVRMGGKKETKKGTLSIPDYREYVIPRRKNSGGRLKTVLRIPVKKQYKGSFIRYP